MKLFRSEEEILQENLEKEKQENIEVLITASEKQHIAHQIINCVSFITSDAERAKIELTALAKKLKN